MQTNTVAGGSAVKAETQQITGYAQPQSHPNTPTSTGTLPPRHTWVHVPSGGVGPQQGADLAARHAPGQRRAALRRLLQRAPLLPLPPVGEQAVRQVNTAAPAVTACTHRVGDSCMLLQLPPLPTPVFLPADAGVASPAL